MKFYTLMNLLLASFVLLLLIPLFALSETNNRPTKERAWETLMVGPYRRDISSPRATGKVPRKAPVPKQSKRDRQGLGRQHQPGDA